MAGVEDFLDKNFVFVFDCFLMPVNSFFEGLFWSGLFSWSSAQIMSAFLGVGVFGLVLLESLILAQDERWRRA